VLYFIFILRLGFLVKQIAILGSTGSIGVNALNVARHLSDRIQVKVLAAHSNIDLLEKQALEFQPSLIAVFDSVKAKELRRRLPHFKIVEGMEGVCEAASYGDVELVITAMVGTAGLLPTVEAIKAGKNIGLANKETLVAGGAFIMKLAQEYKVSIIPIDSEHSALFQCLKGEKQTSVSRLILTSSGGPFRTWSEEQIANVTVEQALNHPTWKMGPKVTIDSSTLMNKGLEVIEAHWLFNIDPAKIEVVIHPQSVIHSMIEFVDQSMLAQMGEPSMIVPIQYAMTYPERCPGLLKPFDFMSRSVLEFSMPDKNKFRCLRLAYDALECGKSMPCYMNAANEILVERFLAGKMTWHDISVQLEELMQQHKVIPVDSLDAILAVDAQARKEASNIRFVSI
jgi:1-deoxy-D-xylulose-5-phosphate reductoisomerase